MPEPSPTAPAPVDSLEKTINEALTDISEKTRKEGKEPSTSGPIAPAAISLPPPDPTAHPVAAVEDITEEAIGDFIGGSFSMLALRYGDHWELQEFEKNQLAKPLKKILDKYSIKMSPETMFIVAAGMVIGPRVWLTTKKPAPAKASATAPKKTEAAEKKEQAAEQKKEGDNAGFSGGSKPA